MHHYNHFEEAVIYHINITGIEWEGRKNEYVSTQYVRLYLNKSDVTDENTIKLMAVVQCEDALECDMIKYNEPEIMSIEYLHTCAPDVCDVTYLKIDPCNGTMI